MFWGWLWVNRWTEPVGGGQGGSVQGTCTRRHIQCQACVADPHHLPRGEYFNAHFTEEETEARGGLGFLGPPLHSIMLPLCGSSPTHSQPSLLTQGFISDQPSSPHPARVSSSPAHSMALVSSERSSSLPQVLAQAAIHPPWTMQSSPTLQAVSSHPQT